MEDVEGKEVKDGICGGEGGKGWKM